LVSPCAKDSRHALEISHSVHQLARILASGEDVEIADRFLAAAIAAGHIDLDHAGALFEMLDDRFGIGLCIGQVHPPADLG
jgi:hypothetical protein